MCVVNLQGDEPFAPAAGIRAVAALLQDTNATMATLATTIDKSEDPFDPNIVKLVCDVHGKALYFSRAPIPWHREDFATARKQLTLGPWLRHIGIYAYNAGFLQQFAAMPPSTLERIESWNNYVCWKRATGS